jgi:hypothetical protein
MRYMDQIQLIIEWMVANAVKQGLLMHYLDDYLFVGRRNLGTLQNTFGDFP